MKAEKKLKKLQKMEEDLINLDTKYLLTPMRYTEYRKKRLKLKAEFMELTK